MSQKEQAEKEKNDLHNLLQQNESTVSELSQQLHHAKSLLEEQKQLT